MNQRQTLSTHNTDRPCRVRFYAFVGQPLSKQLYPIRFLHSSVNYRKNVQLDQLVKESDLFLHVKRQIKTVLTNVVAEHVKSRMSNAKQGNSESVVHNKPELNKLKRNVMMFY